ncbi:MAG: hypothetical protein GYA24_20915, partial [Candidatus Lokiarchaeota archaeon]|nr:hypothetical protein [Candidatus Lokiarchaeota archaeon]
MNRLELPRSASGYATIVPDRVALADRDACDVMRDATPAQIRAGLGFWGKKPLIPPQYQAIPDVDPYGPLRWSEFVSHERYAWSAWARRFHVYTSWHPLNDVDKARATARFSRAVVKACSTASDWQRWRDSTIVPWRGLHDLTIPYKGHRLRNPCTILKERLAWRATILASNAAPRILAMQERLHRVNLATKTFLGRISVHVKAIADHFKIGCLSLGQQVSTTLDRWKIYLHHERVIPSEIAEARTHEARRQWLLAREMVEAFSRRASHRTADIASSIKRSMHILFANAATAAREWWAARRGQVEHRLILTREICTASFLRGLHDVACTFHASMAAVDHAWLQTKTQIACSLASIGHAARKTWKRFLDSPVIGAIRRSVTIAAERATARFSRWGTWINEWAWSRQVTRAQKIKRTLPAFRANTQLTTTSALVWQVMTVSNATTSAEWAYRQLSAHMPGMTRNQLYQQIQVLVWNKMLSPVETGENLDDGEDLPLCKPAEVIAPRGQKTRDKPQIPAKKADLVMTKAFGHVYRIHKNRPRGKHLKAILAIGVVCLTIFVGQLIVGTGDVVQDSFQGSGIRMSSSSSIQVGDTCKIQFTANSSQQAGTGWVSFSSNGVEMYRVPSVVRQGFNEISVICSRDAGFLPGSYEVKVQISWWVLIIFQMTQTVFQSQIQLTPEQAAVDLECSISLNAASSFKVGYEGVAHDDDSPSTPLQFHDVDLSWYNIASGNFEPVATVQTDALGRFVYWENRTQISPFPFIAKAAVAPADWLLGGSDDDSVSQQDVYMSWHHAGPDGEVNTTTSGLAPIDDTHITSNSTALDCKWNFGTINGSSSLGDWELDVMEGLPYHGMTANEFYVGTFSKMSAVRFWLRSPRIFFEGKGATAQFHLRVRSLWEKHGLYTDKPRSDSLYTYKLSLAVLDEDGIAVGWFDLIQTHDLAWCIPVVNLTALFSRPMTCSFAIIGEIDPLTTGVADLWDEEMLLFDYVSFKAVWPVPLYVASGQMIDWAGYSRYVNSAESANASLFSGQETLRVTNMPSTYSNVSSNGIYSSIGTPTT